MRGEIEYCESTGKAIFATRQEAYKALRDMNRRSRGNGSVYQCPVCKGYHVSRVDPQHGKAIRDSLYRFGYLKGKKGHF